METASNKSKRPLNKSKRMGSYVFFFLTGMDKTMLMTRNHNHDDDDDDDDASIRKMIKKGDDCDVAPFSDLNHDVGVCKSWRSLALCSKRKFMASRPPMSILTNNNENVCYLKDFDGRMFQTIIPYLEGRICVGLTCGYLILFGKKTEDFWALACESYHKASTSFPRISIFRGILVFAQSISKWVFVVVNVDGAKIWFSVAGEGAWKYDISTFPIVDVHAFKGKIYTLHRGLRLCEMRLMNPKPKFTLLTHEYYWKTTSSTPKFASSGENLYVSNDYSEDPYVYELDFGKMEWRMPEENTILFFSNLRHGVVIKPELWSQYKRYECFYNNTDKFKKGRFFSRSMWYYPHLCLDVDNLDE
ncbi:hypothetical protein LXL04_010493 [Taraxacum kok-saghyz]